ncbi:hypothetical protein JXA56_02150 [Candidatus Micrarchaeota archaeon]|nr:hypothetical protein [Candidatus Micrarchaeota archaeon]
MIQKVTPKEFSELCKKFDNTRSWKSERTLHRRNDGRIGRVFCASHGNCALVASFIKDSIAQKGQSEPPESYENGTWDMMLMIRKDARPQMKVLIDLFDRKAHYISMEPSISIDPAYNAIFRKQGESAEIMVDMISKEIDMLNAVIERVINDRKVKKGYDNIECAEALELALGRLPAENNAKSGVKEATEGILNSCRTKYYEMLGALSKDRELITAMEIIADKD